MSLVVGVGARDCPGDEAPDGGLKGGGLVSELEQLCRDRLDATGVSWRESTNHEAAEAMSCRQAVRVRDRVGSGGNGGVPLWVELKSFVGAVRDPDGTTVECFAAHTRANTQFVHLRLLEVLGYDPRNHSIRELAGDSSDFEVTPDAQDASTSAAIKEWFGLVNPFVVDRVISSLTGTTVSIEEVRQIVDVSIELDGGHPNSMMTNLGVRTRAMEIAASDVGTAISSVSPLTIHAAVSEPCPIWLGVAGKHKKDYWLKLPPPTGPKIGILTGNGPESGQSLWRDVTNGMRDLYEFAPDLLMPAVVINSVPAMGLSMDLVQRVDVVRRAVLAGITDLLDAGCQLVTIACNTTIYFADEIRGLCEQAGAEFVSIADACMRAITNISGSGLDVGIVGIGPVVDVEGEFSGYKAPLKAHGITPRPIPADDLAFAVKSKGDVRQLVTKFRNLMRDQPPVAVLALTEISMLYRQNLAQSNQKQEQERTYIDPLAELGEELVYRYLLRGYLENEVCQIPDAERTSRRLQEELNWREVQSDAAERVS